METNQQETSVSEPTTLSTSLAELPTVQVELPKPAEQAVEEEAEYVEVSEEPMFFIDSSASNSMFTVPELDENAEIQHLGEEENGESVEQALHKVTLEEEGESVDQALANCDKSKSLPKQKVDRRIKFAPMETQQKKQRQRITPVNTDDEEEGPVSNSERVWDSKEELLEDAKRQSRQYRSSVPLLPRRQESEDEDEPRYVSRQRAYERDNRRHRVPESPEYDNRRSHVQDSSRRRCPIFPSYDMDSGYRSAPKVVVHHHHYY